MQNFITDSPGNAITNLTGPRDGSPPCPLCGRSTLAFSARRSALLDTITLLLTVLADTQDPDTRELALAVALDAKRAAEDVAL